MALLKVWNFSVANGNLHIECPCPLSAGDRADIKEFLELVQRQIAHFTVEPEIPVN